MSEFSGRVKRGILRLSQVVNEDKTSVYRDYLVNYL